MRGKSLWMAILVLVVFISAFAYASFDLANKQEQRTVRVNDLFVDINEDGNIDLLVRGDVILNRGNFQEALPTTP